VPSVLLVSLVGSRIGDDGGDCALVFERFPISANAPTAPTPATMSLREIDLFTKSPGDSGAWSDWLIIGDFPLAMFEFVSVCSGVGRFFMGADWYSGNDFFIKLYMTLCGNRLQS
jgi:hypothetical protein